MTMLTASALPRSPVRVRANVPVSVPGSAALASVAVTLISGSCSGTTTAARQALLPALAGAAVLALLLLSVMSAASWRPRLSVTVRRSVVVPVAGATTTAVAVLAPTIPGGAPLELTTVHAWLATLRPQAAALPPPWSVTSPPGVMVEPMAIAAMGRKAAVTAPAALAMPAPQVLVVQEHSVLCTSDGPVGT